MIGRIYFGLLLALLTGVLAFAQTTRNVDLSWTASTSSSVTGYTVSRGTSASGPFTALTSSPVMGTSYVDSTAVVGSTYTYQVVAVAPACTSTTPTATACGSSTPASATTNVPPQPTAVVTVTVTVP